MNKASLKTFAIEARIELREKIENKLHILGISKNEIKSVNDLGNQVEINGELYSKKAYKDLKEKYLELGFEQLLEESAYTWFNRLVALAYMEVNNYIEDKMVFNADKHTPAILDEYYKAEFFENLALERKEEIEILKDKGTKEDLEKLYAILILEKCAELSKIMPFMFSDETEEYKKLVFPKNLLSDNSFLIKLRKELLAAKDEKTNIVAIELIGWLYQYYNAEKREVVYDGSMKKAKITSEYVAPATQLFTPDWIVKYIVENSLGRLADENFEIRKEIKDKWKYYIQTEKEENKGSLKIEEIKIIDPAMGSGHMLTYAFDLLFEIYEELGWSKKDAVLSILKNNLYGLEIDERAAQLATFAILMKAREKFTRIFRNLENLEESDKFIFNTLNIEESNSISEATRKLLKPNLLSLVSNFEDTKEYGSILKIADLNIERLKEEIKEVKEKFKSEQKIALFNEMEDFNKIEKLIHQYEIMSSKYDITITNPPYMGSSRMAGKLKEYIEKNYSNVKSDLFAVFFIKCCALTKPVGYLGFMSPFVWMFIKSYEELRNIFINSKTIISLVQLEYSGFEDATVPICTFVLQNSYTDKKGEYIKLSDFKGAKNQPIKTLEAIANKKCAWRFQANQKDFEKIPGSPIAYWVSDKVREIFESKILLSDISIVRKGMDTGNNDIFMRKWNEVNYRKIGIKFSSESEVTQKNKKWIPYNKGGEFRKWYGNQEFIVEWENNGEKLKEFKNSNLRSKSLFFKKSLSWTLLSSSKFGLRFYPEGFIFDSNGSSIFFNETQSRNMLYIEALLLTKLSFYILQILSSTLAFNIGDLANFPIIETYDLYLKEKISKFCKNNNCIAKEEWDSRETSWDFEKLSLIDSRDLKTAYENYCNHWRDNFVQLHKNEEELNRLFIEIYDLQDEMDEKVSFDDITILKKEANIIQIDNSITKEFSTESEKYLYDRGVSLEFNKDELVKQFLSYAVGCIMGRYSIDKEGLIMANSDDVLERSENKFIVKGEEGIRHEILNPRFIPEEFGIISFTEEESFENDIVKKVVDFLIAVYGKENLNENLEFIAKALGGKEGDSPKEILRAYFIKDFYKDHLQRYQKRPIYWLMNSGNRNAFSALIYLHRYETNTVARVRTDYLLKYQEKMIKEKEFYERDLLDHNLSSKDKKNTEKKIKDLDIVLKGLKDYANEVKHIAEQKIALDLDDGVKVNYEKLGAVLKKV